MPCSISRMTKSRPDMARISTTTGDDMMDQMPITGWPAASLALIGLIAAVLSILKAHAKEGFEFLDREVEHLAREAREYANPEGVVHDAVCVGQLARNAEISTRHIRLARQVARKQKARADLVFVEIGQEIDPVGAGFWLER